MKTPTQQKQGVLPYLFLNSTFNIVIFLCFTIGLAIVIFSDFSFPMDYWEQYLDQYLAIGAVAFAILIWFNEQRSAYRAQLPKKLNVYFYHNNKVCATIKNAPLTSESDIRNWGQSLGGNYFCKHPVRLSFAGFQYDGPHYKNKKASYNLIYYLNEPLAEQETTDILFDDDGIKLNS